MITKLLLWLSKRLIAFGNGCDIPCECARYRGELAKRKAEGAPYRELRMILNDYSACMRVHERLAQRDPLATVRKTTAKSGRSWLYARGGD